MVEVAQAEKYSPDQPRVPAGQEGGGQWTRDFEHVLATFRPKVEKAFTYFEEGEVPRELYLESSSDVPGDAGAVTYGRRTVLSEPNLRERSPETIACILKHEFAHIKQPRSWTVLRSEIDAYTQQKEFSEKWAARTQGQAKIDFETSAKGSERELSKLEEKSKKVAFKSGSDDYKPDLDWTALTPAVVAALRMEFEAGVRQMIAEGAVIGPDELLVLDKAALEYAHERAAELVGMRVTSEGMTPNPNARWAITETTRETLQGLVEQAFEDGWSPAQLSKQIQEAAAFGRQRAMMIARTELARAQVAGGLRTAAEGGVTHKRWLINPASPTAIEDECGGNAKDGWILVAANFSSGDVGPPQHPNCECTLVFGSNKEVGSGAQTF
jgi:hypothetical protein